MAKNKTLVKAFIDRQKANIFKFAYLMTSSDTKSIILTEDSIKRLKKEYPKFIEFENLWVLEVTNEIVQKKLRKFKEENKSSLLMYLDTEERACMILKDHFNLEYKDIASITKHTEDNISLKISTARLKLVEILNPEIQPISSQEATE